MSAMYVTVNLIEKASRQATCQRFSAEMMMDELFRVRAKIASRVVVARAIVRLRCTGICFCSSSARAKG
jgi:hypothetical protein